MYFFVIIDVRDTMKVKIIKLDDFGRGIAYLNDKICFIENTLPNEEVEIKITRETKKFLEAEVINYLKKSPKRNEDICPYFSTCGGCNLFHLNFREENDYKKVKVKNLIEKFSNLKKDIVKEIYFHEEKNYRNKITLHGKNKKLGLYKKGSNEIVEITECLLVNEKINTIIKELNQANIDIQEAIIKTSNDEKFSILKITGEVNDISKLKKIVDVLIINDKLISQQDTIITQIGSKKYHESADSFFQVNQTLTKNLYDAVLNKTKEIKPQKVLDLYCGTGTIGIYVSDYCQEIVGIDYSKSNIADANKNKELNNVKNIKFICDKVENRITDFKDINVVIVDPPRAGLDSKTRKNLLRINSDTIIYISCDSVTLVRDINELSIDYEVESIVLYNMFPRTHHVENVCILNKK